MSPIKLLIFDLDGTLIDSLPDLAEAVNHARSGFGLGRLSEPEIRILIGQGARSLIEGALPGFSSADVDRGLAEFLDYNLAHIADRTLLYPGVAETLETLAKRGFELCLLSNKNVAHCRELLHRLGIASYFSQVYGADSFPFRKPSPEPVLAILKAFGVKPEEGVMIGDSINDVAAGKGAGVLTIGCSFGYGEPEELERADFRVSELSQILDLPDLCRKNDASNEIH